MTQAIRLYLDENGMSAWERRNGQTERIADFPENPDGLDAFSHFLTMADKRNFLLLINRHEERYLGEAMPSLPQHERRQLAETRSRRAFPDTPWRCVGLNKGRREENTRISLMAVSNSSAFDGWTQRLRSVALSGVYTLPQLLTPLLGKVPDAPAQLVVLSKHCHACRLTLLEHGLPCAVQWTTNDDDTAIDDAWLRLLMQGSAAEIPPTLCIIGPPEWHPPLPACTTIRHLPTNEDAAQLILALADKHWPDWQFAPPSARAIARQRQYGRWCWYLGMLALGAGLSMSVERWLEFNTLHQQVSTAQQHLAHAQQAVATAMAELDRDGMTPAQRQQFIQEHRQLLQQRSAFADDLVALSRALNQRPEIQLDSIDWRIPTEQALTNAHPQLQLDGSIQAADEKQAGELLQSLRQPGHQAARLITRPQTISPGEFRFSLQLLRMPLGAT